MRILFSNIELQKLDSKSTPLAEKIKEARREKEQETLLKGSGALSHFRSKNLSEHQKRALVVREQNISRLEIGGLEVPASLSESLRLGKRPSIDRMLEVLDKNPNEFYRAQKDLDRDQIFGLLFK